MPDDKSNPAEPNLSFSERVTIDTLAGRPTIPFFDGSLREWEPEMAVRLEGKLSEELTPANMEEGDQRINREPAVVIIGPEDNSGFRNVAVYYKSSGQRNVFLDGYYLNGFVKPAGEEKASLVIREGETAALSFGAEGNPQRDVNFTLEIDSIRTGPLS